MHRIKSSKKRISPCHPLKPCLKTLMSGKPLQVTHHGDYAIRSHGPAKGWNSIGQVGEQIHRMRLAVEGCHHSTLHDFKSFVMQSGFQQIRPCVGGRQDGEMGHEPNARFCRP